MGKSREDSQCGPEAWSAPGASFHGTAWLCRGGRGGGGDENLDFGVMQVAGFLLTGSFHCVYGRASSACLPQELGKM